MKSTEKVMDDLVSQWLAKAQEDLDVAKHLMSPEVAYPNAAAFHCQQAAEKLMKAVLVAHQVAFPKTHDLEELLRLVTTVDESLASALDDIGELNPYSVEYRYPGDAPDVTPREAKAALDSAMNARALIVAALTK
jgi:HEPN domain-containing protein